MRESILQRKNTTENFPFVTLQINNATDSSSEGKSSNSTFSTITNTNPRQQETQVGGTVSKNDTVEDTYIRPVVTIINRKGKDAI